MIRPLRLVLLIGTALLLAFCAARVLPPILNPNLVLYAQSVPTTKLAQWSPNATTDHVTSYTLTLDSGTPVVVQASACTATNCTLPVTLTTFGNHSFTVLATNTDLSGGANVIGTPQNSPIVTVPFALNQAPGAVGGATIK